MHSQLFSTPVEQSEESYTLVENKALSVNARAILEAYLEEVEAGYTDVFEPQNVTNFCPTDVTVGDDGFGTAVFSMPENAVDQLPLSVQSLLHFLSALNC